LWFKLHGNVNISLILKFIRREQPAKGIKAAKINTPIAVQ